MIETPAFIRDAVNADLTSEEHGKIAMTAAFPKSGPDIPGPAIVRKIRFAGRGKGKSGGYRAISFYAGRDVPVVLTLAKG